MRRIKRTLLVALLGVFILTGTGASAAPALIVTVDGETYTLSTAFVSYDGASELLESQPWWGDAGLAASISNTVRYQLGDLLGGNQTSGGIPAALVAYGLETVPDEIEGEVDFVSIAYWSGSPNDCPVGCPRAEDTYSYMLCPDLSPFRPMHPGLSF